jgi:c-di-GMP-binding flagellar brake protein YcgR
MQERRKHVRLIESLKIIYKVSNQSGSRKGAFTEDISGGGICLSIKQKLSVGDIIELELFLPKGTKPIRATGKVSWVEVRKGHIEFQYMVGIKFIDIDPFDCGKVLNYIRKKITSKTTDEVDWIDG